MKILIGADLVATKSNYALFERGDILNLCGEDLIKLMQQADYRIFNLEVPLTDVTAPIPKCGPNLIAPISTINGMSSMKVDFLTLANNHILDQGEQGLQSTIFELEKNGIAYAGVGDDLNQAAKPHIETVGNKKIGIYCCAEHEFSIATQKSCGANPFDPLVSLDHISSLKSQTDYVIVLFHAGKEHYRYPTPNLQKTCRKIAEKGADLVICQHSHCIGCEEKYQSSTIVYGQGNFLFDLSSNEFWNTSLLILLEDNNQISYIPIIKNGNAVRLAKGVQATEILEAFKNRSTEILQPEIIEQKYKQFASEFLADYLLNLRGTKMGLFFRVINKLSRQKYKNIYIDRKYNKKAKLAIENIIGCEAHRELLLHALRSKNN